MKYKKLILFPLKVIGYFVLIIILYFVTSFSISSIAVNSDFKECEKDAVEIYILTSGVHCDLVLPFQNQYMDWSKYVTPEDTKLGKTTTQYAAFGWGDKGFFLQTKTWGDMKFSTTFNALFYLSTSAMHVTFHDELKETELCKKICISSSNYSKLVDFVKGSFKVNSSGLTQNIEGFSYNNNDSFYEANGTYSLFNTCNTWANNGLKSADLKACLWTPFDSSIFNKYKD